MSKKVYRCFVEKKQKFDVAARSVQVELSEVLRLPRVQVRLFIRYDIQNLPPERWQEVLQTVLSDPISDHCFEETLPPLSENTLLLCVESLPGQFDQRADSCEQCIQMLLVGKRPLVRTALVYAFEGITESNFQKIKTYLVNPVESRETSPTDKPETLILQHNRQPDDIPVIERLGKLDTAALDVLRQQLGLAMSLPDLSMIQKYFHGIDRDPTYTELRVLDAYWSDHCRHTTFNTIIDSVDIQDERVKNAYHLFLSVNGDKPVTLMEIATATMKHLRRRGELPMLDESAENNACTVRIRANFPHGGEDWLLFFKNETHNHPTEIEPFGGASTCIGGAIRDPLSGRAYAYQAMRITGSGNPRKSIEETPPGKLPQRKLTTTAARGYSAYGNQIGLATGYVKELYHEGYVAKRMEAGAVVAAAPRDWVRRETPAPGDVVVLLGGRTGRDGIGGATGSSKMHGEETVTECVSEVQKGDAPEERKLLRLFRNPEVTKLIKRCNDFGAGGASVAIGELAEGVEITLDNLPVKYEGMDGTELALSESQERMALVVAQSDLETLKRYAEAENVEATVVARITENKKLTMSWRGKKIVDIDRAFLDTNGAKRSTKVRVPNNMEAGSMKAGSAMQWSDRVNPCSDYADLRFCSQKGLVEHFDPTNGAASVFVPFGGKYALTETQVMAALLPAPNTTTASVMAYGFDPYLTEADPFGGSVSAVVTSVAKLVAVGVPLDTIHLSLQEFFPSVRNDPERWGLPFAAMLGAFSAQMGLNIAAIGGKDSMSGSFGDWDVPPTLISFAVGIGEASQLISPEFKGADHPVYLLPMPALADGLPDYAALRNVWNRYTELCRSGKILSAWACEADGVCGGVKGGITKMALGNMIGMKSETMPPNSCANASIIFEATEKLNDFPLLGYTQSQPALTFGQESFSLEQLCADWEAPLESIFPTRVDQPGTAPLIEDTRRPVPRKGTSSQGTVIARPKAVIPVFPGTNCEYDTAAALERAGSIVETVMIRNLTPELLQSSIAKLEKAIASAQMLVLSGGFSGNDEPDGSGKYIVSLFRNPKLADAVHELIQSRDGLILGICNGFQALIKLGLLPFGRITPMTPECPTLTFNRIGRHQARYVRTRVSSVISPWISECKPGELYLQPISHGEGRLTATEELLTTLKANGQIVFQYADYEGVPSMDIAHNPNGSDWAVEGLCSADGRILGKMGHTERYGEFVAKNIPGNKYLPLFEGGVKFFQ